MKINPMGLLLIAAALGVASTLQGGSDQPAATTDPAAEAARYAAAMKTYNAWTKPKVVDFLAVGSRVTSGVRSVAENVAARGMPDSQHLDGLAVDVDPPSTMSAADVVLDAKDRGVPVDQGIAYATSRGGHAHLSTRVDRKGLRGSYGVGPRGGGFLWGLEYVQALQALPDGTAAELQQKVLEWKQPGGRLA